MPLMFLNGEGMAGQPLHPLLRGAPLVAAIQTAPRYRFFSVGDRFPALQPVAEGGAAISGEVYDVPLEVLRESLLPSEPPELELGIIELADGRPSLGMVLRRHVDPPTDLRDISGYGGWLRYREAAGDGPG